jgi:hypothetical protein
MRIAGIPSKAIVEEINDRFGAFFISVLIVFKQFGNRTEE